MGPAMVPSLRITSANAAPRRPSRDFVLYWMTASRRRAHNWALARAVAHARELALPLVVLEPLRCDHPFANARLHRFMLDGMRANRAAFADRKALYWPYVEPEPGAARGLLAAFAALAAVVVTDEYPCYFLPAAVAAAAARIDVQLELVDGNGLVPLRVADRTCVRAVDFRRFLQKALPRHLAAAPPADPLAGRSLPRLAGLPPQLARRWPAASEALLAGDLAELPIDQTVAAVPGTPGGAEAGGRVLRRFLEQRLGRYADDHSHPDREATSGLSPYLHFGHVGVHEVFAALARHEQWTPDRLSGTATGKRDGYWGMSAAAEAFVDQLVTWRELGFHVCHRMPDTYDRFESLPEWARRTLAEHATDRRDPCYELPTFAAAATHDPLWNAAQRQLLREGTIQNYLRMLWGKKILEWSRTPQEALATMLELNNRYALDGRDPNSYSGIFWCLGRHDRPWAPKRPIFGMVRFMSSASTMRKLRLRTYLERFGCDASS